MAPTYCGSFELQGEQLRKSNINRIGNLVLSNTNYIMFEEFMQPIMDELLAKQKEGFVWSPSSLIALMGERINNEESIYYWCWKNEIPVFCPGVTDGAIGDALFVHSFNNE
jgi:deoxyhypusine synthase